MHNKKHILIISLFLLFLFTGCARVSLEGTINEDHTINCKTTIATLTMGAENNMTDAFSEDNIADAKKEFEKEGYICSIYKDNDGYLGITTEKTLNLNDYAITGEPFVFNEEMNVPFVVTKMDEDTFNITIKTNDSSNNITGSMDSASQLKSMGGYMKLILNLPKEPIESNATTIMNNGQTLEFDLIEMLSKETPEVPFVTFSCKQNSSAPIFTYIAAIIAGIIPAIIIIVIYLIIKKKKV